MSKISKKQKEIFLTLKGWTRVPEHWKKHYTNYQIDGNGESYSEGYFRLTVDTAYEKELTGQLPDSNVND